MGGRAVIFLGGRSFPPKTKPILPRPKYHINHDIRCYPHLSVTTIQCYIVPSTLTKYYYYNLLFPPVYISATMGIQGQGSLLFKSKEIEFNNIVYLIEHRHAKRERSQMTLRVRPKVTIDASLIGYKYLGTSLHPSNGVHLICTALANRNIDVLIVCDPPTRHHSK